MAERFPYELRWKPPGKDYWLTAGPFAHDCDRRASATRITDNSWAVGVQTRDPGGDWQDFKPLNEEGTE